MFMESKCPRKEDNADTAAINKILIRSPPSAKLQKK